VKPVREDIAAADHVSKAKEELDAADALLLEKTTAREAAEAQVEELQRQSDEAMAGILQSKELRIKAEETLKELRSKFRDSRREADQAKSLLEKVNRNRLLGSEQLFNFSQNVAQSEKAVAAVDKSVEEAYTSVRAAEVLLSKSIDECDMHSRGAAESSRLVSAPKTMTSLTKESLKTLRKYLDTMAIQQAELECANEGLSLADKGLAEAERSLAGMGGKDKPAEAEVQKWSAEQRTADVAYGKEQEKAEETWEETTEVVTAFVDGGVAFAETLEAARGQSLKMAEVRACQHAAKTAFRQVASAFIGVRRAREALAKVGGQRRKAMHKATAASSLLKQAEHKTSSAECSYACASGQEETRRAEFDTVETQVSVTEVQRNEAECKEVQLKMQREDLKVAIPLAKEAAKVARVIEKEATAEREKVKGKSSKVLRAQSKMEDLMTSAVEKLKSEEYNTRQHEMAYEGIKRTGSKTVLYLPDCKEAATAASKTYDEACTVARSSEEKLSEAFKASLPQLVMVDEEGRAAGEGIVDVPVEKLTVVKTAIGILQSSLDTMAIRQAELECADEDLNEAFARLTESGVALAHARARCASSPSDGPLTKSFRATERTWKAAEKMAKQIEEFQAKAQLLSEGAWEEMSQGVQAASEAGIAFAEAFEPSEARKPLLGQVTNAQHTTRRAFRQVSSAAIAVRRAREGWVKAAGQRRKTLQKESAAMIAHAEAGNLTEN